MEFLKLRLDREAYAPAASRIIEGGAEDKVVLEVALADLAAIAAAGGLPISTFGNTELTVLPHVSLLDPFNALRVSQGETIFDSKQTKDKNPTFWNEVGSGTATSVHSIPNARTRISVAALDDFWIRQTWQPFNYQPGKGQRYQLTGVMPLTAGVIMRAGAMRGAFTTPYEPTDGVWFEQDNGVMYAVRKKFGEQAIRKPQSEWNYDKLDGSGPSGEVADWSKSQIFHIDYEWLGVGTSALAVVIKRRLRYVHFFHNSNEYDSVYMSTPNLHARYEIRSTGGSGFMDHICTTVISEGGSQELGVVRAASTEGTAVTCTNAGTVYPIMAMRAREGWEDHVVRMLDYTTLCGSNDDIEVLMLMNPTFTGTALSWTPKGVGVEVARPDNTTTISAVGDEVDIRFFEQRAGSDAALNSSRYQGVSIGGVRDIMCLAVRGVTAGAVVNGSMIWRELL